MGSILPVDLSSGGRVPPDGREQERIRQTAEELEGVFLGMLLKTMRGAASPGGLFAESSNTQAYREMFDQEVGRTLARAGGIGLAQMILRDQLLRQAAEAQRSDATAEGLAGGGPADPPEKLPLKSHPGSADTPSIRPPIAVKGGAGEDTR